MVKIVVDSSVFIDFARAKAGIYQDLITLTSKNITTFYVPTVVILELWSGRGMGVLENEEKMNRLLGNMKILSLTKQIAKEAGKLRRNVGLDFIDSVIAASSLYLDAQLATSNKKHFEKVKGLRFFGQ